MATKRNNITVKIGLKKGHLIVLACIAAIILTCSQAPAQTAARGGYSSAWQFEITPYLFAAGLQGDTGTRGVEADVDMSSTDILDHLDSALMGMFEARKGYWLFAFEGVYFKMKDEAAKSWQGPLGNTGTGTLEATMDEEVYQLSFGNRVFDESTKVDLIYASRYVSIDSDLDLAVTTGSPLLQDGSNSVSRSVSWWDPVFGLRMVAPLGDNFLLVGYGDIGGFGVGCDLTYQLQAGLNWEFAKNITAKAGYRYLDQDYENGGFVYNMVTSGFYFGLGFKF
jgi:opacity protein-like surface antigen